MKQLGMTGCKSIVWLLVAAGLVFTVFKALAQESQPSSGGNAQQQGQGSGPRQGQGGNRGWSSQQQGQKWAADKIAKSPLHNEWVTIPNGNRRIKAWVIYPEKKGKVPVIVLLHEVFGLTDSTRNTGRQIAEMGYIVITPDMLSGRGPNGGNVDSFEPPYSASDVNTSTNDTDENSDLNAIGDYADKLPSSDGKWGLVGLSWGGGAAFRYVADVQRRDLKVACVFYDIGPPQETQKYTGAPATIAVNKISVPVYGFYGSTDTRPAVTIQATKDAMAAAGKVYDPVTYQDADHAFMRVGEDPRNTKEANVKAVQESLARLQTIFKKAL